MELSIVEIWHTMGFMARLVAVSLIVMGVGSVAIAIERILVLRSAARSSAKFLGSARTLLEAKEYSSLLDLSHGDTFRRSPLASLMRLGLSAYTKNKHREDALEFTKRDLERQLDVLASQARRGMGFLASVGSTAPFIGLFGTVIGIITAFQGIAASGGGGIDAVSAGIAEALIVTAVGLAVAIGSVLVFNFINTKLDTIDMNMQHAASELIDHLEHS